MDSFTLEIWDDERKKCTFYTVTKEGASTSEMEKFLSNFEKNPEDEKTLATLLTFILKSIGDDHGATEFLFNRYENEVIGLPVKGKVMGKGKVLFHFPQFPLRLYALKLNKGIVVLFNGGRKDDDTNQKSSVHLNWVEACQFAKRIIEGIANGEIIVNELERKLYSENGKDEIYLV